jgi:hypothetical protein
MHETGLTTTPFHIAFPSHLRGLSSTAECSATQAFTRRPRRYSAGDRRRSGSSRSPPPELRLPDAPFRFGRRSGVCSSSSGTVSKREFSRVSRPSLRLPPSPSPAFPWLPRLELPSSSWSAPTASSSRSDSGGEFLSRAVSIDGPSGDGRARGPGDWKAGAIWEKLMRRGAGSLRSLPLPVPRDSRPLGPSCWRERDLGRDRGWLGVCSLWDRAYDARSAVSFRTLWARRALSTGAGTVATGGGHVSTRLSLVVLGLW